MRKTIYNVFATLFLGVCLLTGAFAQNFEVPITVTDGVGSTVLTLGIDPAGTDGEDAGLDDMLPPTPPSGFDARFIIGVEGASKDIRGNDLTEKTFVMEYQPETGNNIVVKWDKTSLAALGTFTIVDDITGGLYSQDMLTTDSLDVSTSAFVTDKLRILVTPSDPNEVPVVSDIPDQTVVEGNAFTTINLDDYVTDDATADANITWSTNTLTNFSVVIDANRVATITTLNGSWTGSEEITFTAQDEGGKTGSDPALFTVQANNAPVVSDIPDQPISKGGSFATINLDDYVTDDHTADADIVWSTNALTNLSVDIVDRVATITVLDAEWTGNETITFTAQDEGGKTGSDDALFTVMGEGVTFNVGSTSATNGEVVVPVTVQNFADIIACQFSMHWDPAIVTFDTIGYYGVSGLTAGSFAMNQVDNGILGLSWDEPTLAAQNLNNNDTLFAITFTLAGNSGDSTFVSIDGDPVAIEVIDVNLTEKTYATNPGLVKMPPVDISGQLTYYDNVKTIADATLALSGDDTQQYDCVDNNLYAFSTNAGGNYTVTPEKLTDSSPNNGVTISDILLIRRHILTLEALDSPYKLIAADVNGSGTITTLDIIYIRRLVLATDDVLPEGRFKFVPSDYVFSDPQDPFTHDNARTYTNLLENQTDQDFIGVKLGDVNATWEETGIPPEPLQKSATAKETVNFYLNDAEVTEGAEISIPVKVSDFKKVAACQFTLQWDTEVFEYVGVDKLALAGLSESNFGVNHTANGLLTTAWDDPNAVGVDVADETAIFELKLKAKSGAAGSSSEISFTDSPTVKEVVVNLEVGEFASTAGTVSVAMTTGIDDIIVDNKLALGQNYPNPFNGETQIEYYLPRKQKVTLDVYNVSGIKIATLVNGVKGAGNHNVAFNGNKLSSGVYYYRVITEDGDATKKMQIVK